MIENNTQNQTQISEEEYEYDLFINTITCFSNNLLYATFNDNTSIVVHPSFEYFTYFNNDNTKNDMKCQFLIRQNSIDNKMNLIVSVYNLFCTSQICPFTSKYVSEYNLNCEIINFYNQINFAYWKLEKDFFEEKEKEYYLINSVDGNNKLFLFKNKRIIKVEYLQFYKLNENQPKYSYIKICKFYSVNNLDDCFYIPLFLLLKFFNIKIEANSFFDLNNIQNQIFLNQNNICSNEYKSIIPIIENNKLIHVDNDKHLCNISNILLNPIVFNFHKILPVKFIYTKMFTYLINSNDLEIDIINNEYPYMNIYTKYKLDLLIYQEDPDNNKSIKNIHIDLFDKIYNEEINKKDIEDNKNNLLNNNNLNDENNMNINSLCAEICREILQIRKYGNLKNYSKILELKKERNLKESYNINNNFGKEINTSNDFIFSGTEIYFYKLIKDLGEFYSYKNKSVKSIFKDRTIIMLNPDLKFVSLNDTFGNRKVFPLITVTQNNPYYFYIKTTLDFYDMCFNQENLIKTEEKNKNDDRLVFQRLDTIDYCNSLLFGKKEYFSKQFNYYHNPTELDVENLIKRNDESLKNIYQIKHKLI